MALWCCALEGIWAQPAALTLQIEPVFHGKKIVLNQPLGTDKGDSLVLHLARFYVGQFVFWKKGRAVYSAKDYYLLDLEHAHSLQRTFPIAPSVRFDSLSFQLGVDSLTTANGAMGGDLDPTKGMFWTWQSGYIYVKMEGFSQKSPAPDGAFALHLGGFAAPFAASQYIGLRVPKRKNKSNWQVKWELSPLFDQVDWAKKSNVMSPSKESVRLCGILAKSFKFYE